MPTEQTPLDNGETLQQVSVRLGLERRARILIELAHAEGFNLSIDQVSLQPLQMGNVGYAVRLWPLRNNDNEP